MGSSEIQLIDTDRMTYKDMFKKYDRNIFLGIMFKRREKPGCIGCNNQIHLLKGKHYLLLTISLEVDLP